MRETDVAEKKNAVIRARLPYEQLHEVEKATPNVSKYIRDAVQEKLERDRRRQAREKCRTRFLTTEG